MLPRPAALRRRVASRISRRAHPPTPPDSFTPQVSAESRAAASAAKEIGNKFFTAMKYDDAAKAFSDAITHDPTDHIFYSNRSACYSSTGKITKAVEAWMDLARPKSRNRSVCFLWFLAKGRTLSYRGGQYRGSSFTYGPHETGPRAVRVCMLCTVRNASCFHRVRCLSPVRPKRWTTFHIRQKFSSR